ncbi:hypothetical protein, partial [Zavarzinia compransoris]|uniref:hypothetical protein n=1 Tax=Zavarzinia compransoris TaxID=1264899 RepID=UPI001AAC507C
MAPLRSLLSTTALLTGLAASAGALAQEAFPVSGDQFGYGSRAVAEANFQASLFGGSDSNGGIYGGAPSFTMPLGDSLGVQVDGIGGVVGDEHGFAGGAVQFFYRNPEVMTLGIMAGGYAVEGMGQFAVSAIAEYYIDAVTLEATLGFQDGDVMESTVYGRAGIAVYATQNLRLGAGITYSDEAKLGGDLQMEALLEGVPGLAVFATGSYDDDGAAGYGGLRFYFNVGDSLAATDRTKRRNSPSLMALHRNFVRPNAFLSDPTGFGLRQISRAAAAASGGTPFANVDDQTAPPVPPVTPPTSSTGLIDVVNNAVNQIGNQTAIQPLTDLINGLTGANGGALSAITNPLNQLTQIDGGPLGPLTQLVQGLAGANDSALTPLIDTLNGIIGGLTAGANPDAIAGGLANIPGVGGLTGLFGGGALPGGTDYGLINLVNNTLGQLGDNSAVQPLTDLLNALTDPVNGGLAPVTGALNDLTALQGGPLAPLTELVGALAGTNNAALNPLVNALNGILGGLASGADPSAVASGLSNLPGVGGLTSLFGGLTLPGGSGGSGTGLINLVNNTLGQLGDNSAVQPLTDLLNALTDPVNGGLAPLTGALNDLTALQGGPLAPLTELVGALAGTNNAALNPLVDTLNGILGGLASGADPSAVASGLSNLPGVGGLTSLFGGLTLPGGSGGSGTGLINLVNNTLGQLGDNSAVQPLTDLLNALTDPVNGGLAPLTGALNDLTALQGGPLAPLTELVGSLAGTNNAALNPLVDTLNGILGGLASGADPSAVASGLSNLPGVGGLTSLFG